LRGIGDDAALLQLPAGQTLAVTTDTLVAGRHFPPRAAPRDVGYKSLAVSLSDLAATGAEPRWIFLALTLPRPDESWLAACAEGLFALADRYAVVLAGGDLSRGPLALTVTACGLVPDDCALGRGGARPGDQIWVTGTLGDAGLGLRLEQGAAPAAAARWRDTLLARLCRPQPRVPQGLALRRVATACIDLSDGLARDLALLLEASGAGAVLDPSRLPLSPALRECLPPEAAWELALAAGDDYELCFTAPPDARPRLRGLAGAGADDACDLTLLGTVTSGTGLCWRTADGRDFLPAGAGYRHF